MKWVHAGSEIATWDWAEASARLTSLADWADLLVTGQVYQEVAANVAEYYDIPLGHTGLHPIAGQRPTSSKPSASVITAADLLEDRLHP